MAIVTSTPLQPISALTNITPFTYRDGTNYLEQLELMRVYLNDSLVDEFNAAIDSIITQFNDGLYGVEEFHNLFQTEIERQVALINNRVGPEGIQHVTLTDAYTVTIDPVWPTSHPILFHLTQDEVGGHPVTLGAGITGTVEVDPTPGSVTTFHLVPDGNGGWTVDTGYVLPAGTATDYLNGDGVMVPLTKQAVGLGNVDNTADKDKPVTDAAKARLAFLIGYSPEDYGVATNGVDDATAAFQTMLDGLPDNAVVQVRSGQVIRIAGTLLINKPVTLTGNGRIVANNVDAPTIEIRSNNVTLDGLTFTGPGAALGYQGFGRIITNNATATNLHAGIVLRNLTVTESRSSAVWLTWVKDFVVEGCHIERFQYGGVMILSGKNGKISGNTIKTALMASPLVNAYGIAATDSSNDLAGRSEHILIKDNYVEGITNWEGIDTHSGLNIQVIGNTVRGCLKGIALVSGNSTRTYSPEECIVVGNYVEKMGAPDTAEGINLSGASITNLASATITGNTVRGYTNDIYAGNHARRDTYIAGNTSDSADSNKGSASHPFWRVWTAEGTLNAVDGQGETTVAFPAGMFDVPPIIFHSISNAGRYHTYDKNVTTDGCVIGAYDSTQGVGNYVIIYKILVIQAAPNSQRGMNGA